MTNDALRVATYRARLLSGFSGAEDLPGAQTADLLNHDRAVAHWAGVYFGTVQLDGQAVPALAKNPNASVSPPLLSGHGLDSAQQVVLGTSTLALLHQHVGATVLAGTGRGSPVRLRIVGTARHCPRSAARDTPSSRWGRALSSRRRCCRLPH